MVDRVYKKQLPQLRNDLEKLRENFSSLSTSRTNWIKLRIEPLLKHLDSLEQLLDSEEFSRESLHLVKGVRLFHSDLVYFRENVKGLESVLQSEKKSLRAPRKWQTFLQRPTVQLFCSKNDYCTIELHKHARWTLTQLVILGAFLYGNAEPLNLDLNLNDLAVDLFTVVSEVECF